MCTTNLTSTLLRKVNYACLWDVDAPTHTLSIELSEHVLSKVYTQTCGLYNDVSVTM
eukprot:NODE_3357_length_566_cov_4.845261_g2832_i0.p1 GENE.NODE_3357_length_566_cov_4.845261_g2832_i0~~NODE_3357_length_566_cov_4.845261_g2832_i0.p1  ORF type:complete len:57 (-),score=9.92 NODE_3357_length_566_cov_4.845261_g2832_i0:37-207(-)